MTAVQPPSYLQGGDHSAISDRLTSAAFLHPAGTTPRGVRGGVRPSASNDGLYVHPSAPPDNHVIIEGGTIFVPGTAGGDVYICHNDGPVTRAVPAASSTQNRIDLVVAQVYDPEANGADPDNTWDVVIVSGDPSSGDPTRPDVPPRSLALAELYIAAGSSTIVNTGAIIDLRGDASVALGGVIPLVSLSSLPSNPYRGMTCFLIDLQELRVWAGTGWVFTVMRGLPDPKFIGSNALYNLGLTGTLTNFSPAVQGNLTVIRPTLCTFHISGILKLEGIAYAELYVQLRATGATVWQGSDHTAFGGTLGLYNAVDGVRVDAHSHVTFEAVLDPGTTTFQLQHFSAGNASLRQLQSPAVQITPMRYLEA